MNGSPHLTEHEVMDYSHADDLSMDSSGHGGGHGDAIGNEATMTDDESSSDGEEFYNDEAPDDHNGEMVERLRRLKQ